jgi:hypothetical protein
LIEFFGQVNSPWFVVVPLGTGFGEMMSAGGLHYELTYYSKAYVRRQEVCATFSLFSFNTSGDSTCPLMARKASMRIKPLNGRIKNQ